jgi:hypothetical protein
MPQRLASLKIDEVSLVDAPANSEVDPYTGKKVRRATVAIIKRDTRTGLQRLGDRVNALGDGITKLKFTQDIHTKSKKGKKKMSLKKVLINKSATRQDLNAAVSRQAEKIAKRQGIRQEVAEGRIWNTLYTKVGQDESEAARAHPEPKTFLATPAEAELDKRARKLMKRNPALSYAGAATKALEQDPSLYTRYNDELNSGQTYPVPQQPEYLDITTKQDNLDGEETCPNCGEEVEEGDQFCSACGKPLPQ